MSNSRWVRAQTPDQYRVVFSVNKNDHPELHAFIAQMPFGSVSKQIREYLLKAIQQNNSSETAAPTQERNKPNDVTASLDLKQMPDNKSPTTQILVARDDSSVLAKDPQNRSVESNSLSQGDISKLEKVNSLLDGMLDE
jgi:hypothetical protein